MMGNEPLPVVVAVATEHRLRKWTYQSLPRTRPSFGMIARPRVSRLIDVVTFRTLPSIMPTSIPPLDRAWSDFGLQALIEGLLWIGPSPLQVTPVLLIGYPEGGCEGEG